MKKSNICVSILGGMILAVSINGAQAGKASDAYFVKVDRDTTTENTAGTDPKKKSSARKDKSGAMVSGKRQHKPLTLTKSVDKSRADSKNKMQPGTSEPAPLLLPAVQKAQESDAKSKKKGSMEGTFKVEKGEK